MTSAKETKICCSCGHEKPLDQFHPRGTGTRGSCRDCVRAYMRSYRANQRGRRLDRSVSAIKRARNLNAVIVLCANLIRKFGGVDGFCREWHAHLMAAANDKRGKKRAIDSFLAVLRIMVAIDEARPRLVVSQSTDEDFMSKLFALEANEAMRHREDLGEC